MGVAASLTGGRSVSMYCGRISEVRSGVSPGVWNLTTLGRCFWRNGDDACSYVSNEPLALMLPWCGRLGESSPNFDSIAAGGLVVTGMFTERGPRGVFCRMSGRPSSMFFTALTAF